MRFRGALDIYEGPTVLEIVDALPQVRPCRARVVLCPRALDYPRGGVGPWFQVNCVKLEHGEPIFGAGQPETLAH